MVRAHVEEIHFAFLMFWVDNQWIQGGGQPCRICAFFWGAFIRSNNQERLIRIDNVEVVG